MLCCLFCRTPPIVQVVSEWSAAYPGEYRFATTLSVTLELALALMYCIADCRYVVQLLSAVSSGARLQVPLWPAKLDRACRPSLPHISKVTTLVFAACM